MSSTARIFNFSAGPAVLPREVLEEIQRDLLGLPGVGLSVMEISHRSEAFTELLEGVRDNIRILAGIGSEYRILMLQGGASLQFAMVPMNLLSEGKHADYLETGVWSKKAISEARRIGDVCVVGSSEHVEYSSVPSQQELNLSSDAAYAHFTSNNTIEGTQWKTLPDAGNVPLVCDASSDIFSQPIDVDRYGLIYAGSQKNLGPSGVTLVVIREDLLDRSSDDLAAILNYRVHAEHGSLYNTPNTFGIYAVGLNVKWLLSRGGLNSIKEVNERKAGKLYQAIDRTEFYRGTAKPGSRSCMNVTFRLKTSTLESMFVDEATNADLVGLKGHRSVGGIRASIYNAFPEEGVDVLVQFMQEFERKRG